MLIIFVFDELDDLDEVRTTSGVSISVHVPSRGLEKLFEARNGPSSLNTSPHLVAPSTPPPPPRSKPLTTAIALSTLDSSPPQSSLDTSWYYLFRVPTPPTSSPPTPLSILGLFDTSSDIFDSCDSSLNPTSGNRCTSSRDFKLPQSLLHDSSHNRVSLQTTIASHSTLHSTRHVLLQKKNPPHPFLEPVTNQNKNQAKLSSPRGYNWLNPLVAAM
jgi:hypothetical protein